MTDSWFSRAGQERGNDFHWRGLKFVWFERSGSQAEGWESQVKVGATVIFISVRERDDGSFTAFTTPLLAPSFDGPDIQTALDGMLGTARLQLESYAAILEAL